MDDRIRALTNITGSL